MESAGRLSNWWRRRSGTDADTAGPADADQRATRLAELLAATRAGFPVAPAAHPVDYRCSCDRMDCQAKESGCCAGAGQPMRSQEHR
jgi:hypothetical protein